MHPSPRLYLTGASCAGVSTLGAALKETCQVPQIDVDDFYWLPTDPPFTCKRPPEDRLRLIAQEQARAEGREEGWVLTGSFDGWGDALIAKVDLIIFVDTPTPIRLARLEAREAQRHGARIAQGGDMHAAHLAFRDWAARYDDPAFTGRNRARHLRWLAQQTAPVCHLDGSRPLEDLRDAVLARLARDSGQR